MNKLMFNNYPIKKPSSVINVFKKFQDLDIEITGDLNELFDVFGITDTITEPKVLIDFILENRKNIRSIVNYIKNNTSDIDIPRLLRYIQYRQTNPFSSNNEIGLKLMYGDEKGLELFTQQQNKFVKYYSVEYYMGLGYSEEESLIKIQEYKNNKSTKLSNFIKKYGEIEGVVKYKEYVNKSKNTIDTFKERYGDDWEEKWLNYTKKDSSSYDWALKKANGDINEANKIFNDKLKKTTITLEYLVEKYGIGEGTIKWEEIKRLKDSSSLEFFIKKYGDYNTAIIKYEESNRLKDSSSLDFFINKYGEIGYEKYLEKCKKSDCCSFDYFYKKYGDEKIAIEEYKKEQVKRKVKILKASKTSLEIFQSLYDFLISENIISNNDVFLGIDGSKEYFLKNDEFLFFYDFTILSKKIIIEFNGKAWHPNWEKYGMFECINVFNNNNVDAELAVKKDLNKIKLAKENGFDVLLLWEEDGVDINKEKVYNYLLEKGIRYEN